MSYRGVIGALAALVCAMVVTACGPSDDKLSSAEVADKVQGIAGPDGKVYSHEPIRQPADGGDLTKLLIVVACPPSGDCTIVGRDGATYPDMQTFVDESPDVEPGDQVLANADPTNPDKKPKFVTFTRSDGLGWGWYAGGGALLALLLVAGWLMLRRRRAAPDRPILSG